MKRSVYLIAFTVLGLLVQALVHALVEQWYISLLVSDFERYGFGWSWPTWFAIHHVLTVVFIVLGGGAGFLAGRFFWPRLYHVDGRPRTRHWL